jgi:hypothetical protein
MLELLRNSDCCWSDDSIIAGYETTIVLLSGKYSIAVVGVVGKNKRGERESFIMQPAVMWNE